MSDLLKLAKHWERECNRYIHGYCHTRRCLVRGGWKAGAPDYSVATCKEHETAVALRALVAPHHHGSTIMTEEIK